jgi:peptidoglycan/xylan/chitin deacetylase (PgdA/CDA1 family)
VSAAGRFIWGAKLRLAYFSGYARLVARRRGGAGVILRFERVRPRRAPPFQPLMSREITPQFLDRVIRALKRWKFDIVSMDEACRRAAEPSSKRRFVCLTFDGGTKDLMVSAYPVLARHAVPFTIYLPTAFPDGLGEMWWLALEAVIGRNDQIALFLDGEERRFRVTGASEKYQLYDYLHGWLRTLAPRELSIAINDLCTRYSVDLAAISRDSAMDWEDLSKLAGDPRVTIGSATVHYPVLTTIKNADAQKEIAMGRAVAQAAFHRDIRHFAYPFGGREDYDRGHVTMAAEAGFTSAVSASPGVVKRGGRARLHELPRLSWDGRERSLRVMRVMLSGMMPESEIADAEARRPAAPSS